MSIKKVFLTAAMLGLTTAVWSQEAQDRPGIDRPIRVAMFKGTGVGGGTYWHENIHTSHTVMAGILSNPGGSSLGDSLVIPPAGFTFRTMETELNTAGNECSGNGCGPSQASIASFVSYLTDSADVMILSCVVNFGSRVTNTAHREAIANFWNTKGYVAIHAISDSKGTWAPLDTVHGTQFNNHPREQTGTLRIDSVFQDDPSWQYLNRGMFSNGLDSNFIEEWFFYTNSGIQIRARSGLKPTTKLVEASMSPGNLAMGDHPHSWFRELPTGGRMFYTGLGHRPNVWQGTRTFRRQIYNAILWSAKYDSLSEVSSVNPGRNKAPGEASLYSRLAVTPGALTVTTIQPGSHKVELVGMDGRRVAMQQGSGSEKAYNFTGLRSGVYAVTVSAPAGRSNRLVTIP